MSEPFQLNAFEVFLRRAATLGGYLVVTSHLNNAGTVVADAAIRLGDKQLDRARFLVRGHSAIEIGADDPRGRPARAVPTVSKV